MELSHPEARLLRALPEDGTAIDIAQAVQKGGFSTEAQLLAAADRPVAAGLVALVGLSTTRWSLTREGRQHQEAGLPERRAWQAIRDAGGRLPMGDLGRFLAKPEVSVAVGWLKRKGWASIEKGDGPPLLVAQGAAPAGPDEEALAALSPEPQPLPGHAQGLELLAGRGIVQQHEETLRTLALTEEGGKAAAALPDDLGEEVNQVTPELVARWADMDADARAKVRIRPFPFDAPVESRTSAKPHPLSQLMAQVRRIFWQMGFGEIRGDYVESAFWNMDALFIPQDHPAREEQDTFYLQEPASLDVSDDDLARGRAVHENGGGTGSTGWGGTWSPDVARQGLLRTHTTNTTVRYLAGAFGPGGDKQAVHRVFGLGRVFRNETMDATHLPEFHQIEGIVTEEGASFDMLIGLARHFFQAMGFPDVRFRPAYFPYTEPSMEVDVLYHGKWMELGGCGVFRSEVTQPLDVPHPVLAWGFGLERLAMMRLGIKDIRRLYVPDLKWLQEQALL